MGASLSCSVGCQSYLAVFDMEAVRALQPVKSDDPPAGGASVTVQGDEVLIEHLSVEDRTLVELIEHRRDTARSLRENDL